MYLETITDGLKNPEKAQKRLHAHFFKPYRNACDLIGGVFTPVDALFEDSFPNILYSLLFVGNAIVKTITGLGHLLLAQGKEAIQDMTAVGASIFLTTVSLSLIVLSPLFEAVRLFTRWGATLIENMTKPGIAEEVNSSATKPACA